MNSLKLEALSNFPLINPGDDLSEIIYKTIVSNESIINNNDVIVIAQKIVSKAENRYLDLDNIPISKKAKDLAYELSKSPGLVQAVLNESKEIISTKKNVIIVEHKLGYINVNAGIDLSNIPKKKNLALLLPKNPKKSAKKIQEKLKKKLNKNISIIISDSMTRPYRAGVINFALASYNLQSLRDLKGYKDIYDEPLKGTEVAFADELAAAAGILMGQSNEMKPIIIIKGLNKKRHEINNAFDLIVDKNEDLYR